jgi:two-component system response regulator FlrC
VDGDQALAAVHEHPADVLCSDVVMPGASVIEVVEVFRSANPRGAVLLCSGYVGEELVRRGIEEGLYPSLEKPYTPEALVSAIAELLRESAARPQQ